MRNQSSFFVGKLFARPTRCTPIRWILSLSKGPIEFDDSDRDNSALRRDGQDPSAPTASSRNARLVLLTPLAGYALFIAKAVVGPVNMTPFLEDGHIYVNAHSVAFPAGVVRGQVREDDDD